MDFLKFEKTIEVFNSISIEFIYNYIKLLFYNYFIGFYTQKLYKNFLLNVPKNSTILDIGVGNAYSLVSNQNIIKEKNIKIIGVDIDASSINEAKKTINNNDLNDNIEVHNVNVYQFQCEKVDYIYFSNSFSVIPNVIDMINTIKNNLLKDEGKIVISTTIDSKYNYIKDIVKPNLKKIFFGIDFGQAIVLENFVSQINSNEMNIDSIENVYNRWLPIWGDIDIFTTYISKVKKN